MLDLPSEPQLRIFECLEHCLLGAGSASFILAMLAAFTSIAAALAGIDVPKDYVNTAVTLIICRGFVFLALGVIAFAIEPYIAGVIK